MLRDFTATLNAKFGWKMTHSVYSFIAISNTYQTGYPSNQAAIYHIDATVHVLKISSDLIDTFIFLLSKERKKINREEVRRKGGCLSIPPLTLCVLEDQMLH